MPFPTHEHVSSYTPYRAPSTGECYSFSSCYDTSLLLFQKRCQADSHCPCARGGAAVASGRRSGGPRRRIASSSPPSALGVRLCLHSSLCHCATASLRHSTMPPRVFHCVLCVSLCVLCAPQHCASLRLKDRCPPLSRVCPLRAAGTPCTFTLHCNSPCRRVHREQNTFGPPTEQTRVSGARVRKQLPCLI